MYLLRQKPFSPKIARSRLFFRRQLGLTLGRNLANQHITMLQLRRDMDNAGFIQTPELQLDRLEISPVISSVSQFGVATHYR